MMEDLFGIFPSLGKQSEVLIIPNSLIYLKQKIITIVRVRIYNYLTERLKGQNYFKILK